MQDTHDKHAWFTAPPCYKGHLYITKPVCTAATYRAHSTYILPLKYINMGSGMLCELGPLIYGMYILYEALYAVIYVY